MQTEDQAVPTEVTVPPTTETPEPAHEPAETSTAPGTEQPANATEQPQQEKPKNDWVQRRIDQLTREKHEEKRQREALEARLRELQPDATTTTAQQMTADQIRAEAARLVAQEKFDAACNKVFDAGKTEFPDWDASLRTFQMLGGASPEFLEAVTSMDAGHKVLHHLGQNPEEAERLLSLPPLRMALELARLETTVAQAKPAPVSKAPAPISPVGGKSAPVEPEEFATTADYVAWRKRNRS
ncbi:hypothetical protein KTE13_28880 [Burkholderia multivorans]|uniref:hypothetical protein n=1 Tax=Burkholderia multivorans TaxID=87883 RepID=UPI001C23F4A6|nr:hypothetical protein [Burkholderia multivorans]MBU9403765.1 hypothetical protein [Burkholderia multivorans]